MALRQGRSCRIVLCADGTGRTTVERDPRREQRSSLAFRSAVVSAAGPLAELKYCREMGFPSPDDDCFAGDRANMKRAVAAIAMDHAYTTVCERARRELERPEVWRAVLRLASYLERQWNDRDEVTVSADDVARAGDVPS